MLKSYIYMSTQNQYIFKYIYTLYVLYKRYAMYK